MARTWAQLLGDAEDAPETEEEGRSLFGRLRDSLAKSRRALTEQIVVAAFDPDDDEAWERLAGAVRGVGAARGGADRRRRRRPRDRRADAPPRGARRDRRPRHRARGGDRGAAGR